MKKLLILLLFISFDSYCQDIESVDFVKHLVIHKNSSLIYWKKNMTLFTGVATISYKDGLLSSSRTYKDGEKNGLWREWYENGQIEYEDYFQNGLEHGESQGWYEDGQKEYEWNFKNGLDHGLQRGWDEKGQLEYESNYINGIEIELDTVTAAYSDSVRALPGFIPE